MPTTKHLTCLLILYYTINIVYAQPTADEIGQTIQIKTRLHSFVGRPSWLIIIRDLDHGQNLPYLYDFDRAENFWLAFTYSKNYVIIASTLSFSPYRHDPYRTVKIHNFCNLESNCRVLRRTSVAVTLTGDLSPNPDTYSCYVTKFPDAYFTVIQPINLQ